MARVSKKLLRRRHLHHLAISHKHHSACNLTRKAHLMAYHHHGHAVAGQLLHNCQHLLHHLGI